MVRFLLWDPYFFGYDSKLLELGINGQMMSFWDICQPVWVTTASAGAIAVSTGAVAVSTEAVVASVGAVAASAGTVVGIFD